MVWIDTMESIRIEGLTKRYGVHHLVEIVNAAGRDFRTELFPVIFFS